MRSELELVYKTGERAAALTRQLLAFSRQQVLEPKILDLNAIAQDMDKMLRRLVREDIDQVTVLDPKLKPVKADPGQIEQVIMNLVVNARDAMPDGGKLTIETSNRELDATYTELCEVKPGKFAMLAVSDTGIGMDEKTKARIFEPFFTTKEPGKGTGLGLSTVYGIVKQSGGHIEVYSELGKGTTFKIYLPHAEKLSKEEPTGANLEAVAGGRETVLVVEDEADVRDLVCDLLELNGYATLTAGNGQQALELLRGRKEPIHLIITDVVMPEMGGPELSKKAKAIFPKINLLFTSGYTDNSVMRSGELDSGVHFLQKPFTATGLARKVREILDGSEKA
jgi:CheY-like chemotaxis protein